jgi:hypothetical protein
LTVIALVYVVHDTDVRMLQGGGCLGLMDKTFFGFRIADEFRRKKFQGNRSVKAEVLGFVDNTHTTPAQALKYRVM